MTATLPDEDASLLAGTTTQKFEADGYASFDNLIIYETGTITIDYKITSPTAAQTLFGSLSKTVQVKYM